MGKYLFTPSDYATVIHIQSTDGDFAYMRLKIFFSGTYHLIYGNPRSYYMRIHSIRAYF